VYGEGNGVGNGGSCRVGRLMIGDAIVVGDGGGEGGAAGLGGEVDCKANDGYG